MWNPPPRGARGRWTEDGTRRETTTAGSSIETAIDRASGRLLRLRRSIESRRVVDRERSAARRLLPSFLRLAELDAGVIDGPHAATLVGALYDQHLPLKRWMWRTGLLAAAGDRPPSEIDWP